MFSFLLTVLAKILGFLLVVGLIVGAVGCASVMFKGRGNSGSSTNTGGLPWL